ncbi:MAG TPA: hypothetical protein VGL03_03730 [Thermoanaerobaculia bacterium]
MSGAAAALAERIRESGALRVAFLGLAKNVGKTTALLSVLEEMHRRGIVAGTTSAGRDGEPFDAITGEPKPRFRVWPKQLIASASSTFESADVETVEIATLPFSTRFGLVQLRRVEGPGEIEVIGPSTVSQIGDVALGLEAAGAAILLLDGAVGRRAFACARIADGIVLSVGLAAGASLEGTLAAARAAVELIRLPAATPGASCRSYDGALTEAVLAENPPRRDETLVCEDFAAIFLSPAARRRLSDQGVSLAVRHPARLLAMTANPRAPARPPFPAAMFFEALRGEFRQTPVFDLVADLRSG